MVDPNLGGGHLLPQRWGAASAPLVAPARRPRRDLLLGLLTGALVLAVVGGTHLAANLGYDDARASFSDARTVTEHRQDDLAASADSLAQAVEVVAGLIAADTGTLLPAPERAALDDALSAAGTTEKEARALAATPLPSSGEKPAWTWELFGESARLAAERDALIDEREDIEERRHAIGASGDALEDAAVNAAQTAAAAAPAFEEAHVNARNPEILQLRWVAGMADDIQSMADAAELFSELEAATAAMLQTERAELGEKEGRLHGARVEIEAFARELAPEVLLDFDWSPTVPGYDGPSNGGWTTWWTGEPGYATIALSDYIAENWPDAWTRALVAHEVGHAISVKCPGLYDSSDRDAVEAWATAWAIGKGFTDRANGTAVYGAPSQEMIDTAKTCR